jgi:hypothetical protein
MSTEHQALFVTVLLAVAVAYLYWRVEILARQVRNLSDEIEHLKTTDNLTWKSIRGIGKAILMPSTYTFKTMLDTPNRYQGADGVLYASEDEALDTWRKAENLPPDYEPKWINTTTLGMVYNRYVLDILPANPH